MTAISTNKTYIGILLALTAVIVWSGNYVVARGIIQQVPPIAVAFYRWLLASICIVPFAYKAFKKDLPILLQHKTYLFLQHLQALHYSIHLFI